MASLLTRARLAGRDEVALSARQLEIVLTALEDAAVYRASGADVMGCWDCENIPGGRCADHARDADRARACAELAAQLAVGQPGHPARGPAEAADQHRALPPPDLGRLVTHQAYPISCRAPPASRAWRPSSGDAVTRCRLRGAVAQPCATACPARPSRPAAGRPLFPAYL